MISKPSVEREQKGTVPRRDLSPRRSSRSSQNLERTSLIDDNGYLHYRALPSPPPKANKFSRGQGPMQEDSEELEVEDFHDSGFSEGTNFSDGWSIRHHLSPSRSRIDRSFKETNEYWDSFSRCLELDDDRGMTSSPSPRHRQLEIDSSETGDETPHPDFPACVILGPARAHRPHDRVTGMRDASSVYGRLFEREDPWATIGEILRLPDIVNTFPGSTSTNISQSIVGENTKPECASVVPEDPVEDRYALNSGSPQVADLLSDCSMGVELIASEAVDEEACGYIDDSYDPTFIDLFEAVAGSELAEQQPSRKEESLEEEIDRILGLEEGADADEPLGLVLGVTLGRRDNKPQDVNVWRNAIETELTGLPTVATKEPENQVDQRAKSASPQLVKKSDAGISNEPHESDNGSDLHAIPDLREENGRFLGPSLFCNFEIDGSDEDC
ncbi:unnamed protein product [Cyclocybe aegerita]|uniref:Uncharacterized protein n=1 Tax=Cyclocybe aegerita TaxID=1973307 RepID=A0A8S0VYE6_CYCAE|nr:unnamed protein product [Cyclocybe aegerita]